MSSDHNDISIELPENFDLELSDRFVLIILLETDGLSYVLYQPEVQGSFFYKKLIYNKKISVEANVKEIFFTAEIFTLSYKKLWVISHSQAFTFIPSYIFTKDKKDIFFNFNIDKTAGRVMYSQLKNPDITVVYDIDENVYDFLHRSLVHPVFIHHTCPLIAYFQERMTLGSAKSMVINLRENSFELICFTNGEFAFANHFQYKDLNDLVYYIFYVWKQLKMNQMTDNAYISGDSGEKDKLLKMMKNYIKNIVPVTAPVKNIPFDILILSLCEL